MRQLRPHQEKGAGFIARFGQSEKKGNFVSVACCVSSGKTLLAAAGMAENIRNNPKTCQVFVCPRLNLCKQQAEDIFDYLEESGLGSSSSVVLYNSAKYDGTRKQIHECSNRKVKKGEEFFTGKGVDHVVIVACDDSLWGGKDEECVIRTKKFEKILKNNEEFGRRNVAIIYDEAHNYESKIGTVREFANFFNVSVIMSGTPGKEQKEIHKKSAHVDYSIRSAILDDIICKPTLNVVNGYTDDSYLASTVNSIIANERGLHVKPFRPRLLVCAKSIDAINSAVSSVKDCNVITLHSVKKVVNGEENDEIEIVPTVNGVKKPASETMKIIEDLDKKEDYFGDDKPVVVFQVDMISEGVNIKSFNSVLITSYSEIKQMQQIGRVLRDVEFDGHSKKKEDHVNIYAAVENKDDLAQLLVNLEEYDLTEDVFEWGRIMNASNGSAVEMDEDGMPLVNVWDQIDEVLDIEEILRLKDRTINGQINNRLVNILRALTPEDQKKIEMILLKGLKGKMAAEAKAQKQAQKALVQKMAAATGAQAQVKNEEDEIEETRKTANIANMLRELYYKIRLATDKKTGRQLWSSDKRAPVYQSIGFDDSTLIDEVVNEIGWRF